MKNKAMSTQRVAESILMLPRVDLFAIFNNRRSLVQLAAIKHTKSTPWVGIAKNNFLFLILVAVTIWAAPLDCDSFVDRWADDARIPDQTVPDPENYVCFSDGSTLSAFNKDALKTAILLDPAQAISCQSVQKFLSYVCLLVDSNNVAFYAFQKYGDILRLYESFNRN